MKIWNYEIEQCKINNLIRSFLSILCHKKKLFLCMYKMLQISKEEYEKCEVVIIDNGKNFWVNRKDLEVESYVANWEQFLISGIKKTKIQIWINA